MQSYAIDAEQAPQPIGPYSHMVRVGDTLYLSGQIALHPVSGELITEDIRKEVMQVFANIEAVLEAGGAVLNNIVKLTVFITDLAQFDEVNVVMSELLSPPFPARSTVQVAALPRNATIEVEVIAVAK